MSDDHATHAISSYGSDLIETPNIDALAARGILFQNAFVTNSICAPSRAVILTGKHSHLNGVKDNRSRFDSSQVTFPKILQQHGYETAIVGKWHLKSRPTGFDYWNVLPGQGDYYNPDLIKMGKDTAYTGYVTDVVTDMALDWLSSREKASPFMLMVHHKAPHRNWMPAGKHLDRFNDVEFPKPASFYDDYSGKPHMKNQKLTVAEHMDITWDLKLPCDTCAVSDANTWQRKNYERKYNRFTTSQKEAWDKGYQGEIEQFLVSNYSPEELVEWKYQRYLEDYLRCIVSIDENIGRMLQYLEENELGENTVVIYTSDQGFFLGEHGIFDKRYMYEESLRTPLIIAHPLHGNQVSRSKALVQNLDIAPTILDMVGAGIPEKMQGKSLLPLITNSASGEFRDAVYYQFYETGWGVSAHYGVRTQKYKLIHFTTEPGSWELYDLEEDPHEMNNLHGNPDYDHVIERLEAKLKKLQEQYET